MIKTVLITGAGGFIGSHLTEQCVKQGYKVKAFVRYNGKNDWGWLESSSVKNKIEVICGDVRDYDSVAQAVKGCDTVFHLAALIGIPYSYKSPLAYIKTNVEGTYNILQASREDAVKQVLVTSTSETYGSAQYVPIDEKHPANAQSPYAASKVAADQLALSFYRSFSLPVKIVRPFNTYGPRQSARAIIPTVITQILAGRREIALGNLTPTRDLTYVTDTAKAFLAIAHTSATIGKTVNIGMNEEISIGDLVQLIAQRMNKKVKISTETQRRRGKATEVERLKCDNSQIIQLTGWRPTYTLSDGIDENIAWLKKHQYMYKADIYNV